MNGRDCILCRREEAEMVEVHIEGTQLTYARLCPPCRARWKSRYGIDTTTVTETESAAGPASPQESGNPSVSATAAAALNADARG